MMNSTKVVSMLSNVQISKYYGLFLNAMATIARNFNARIIKNAGDCLIFYFPKHHLMKIVYTRLKMY